MEKDNLKTILEHDSPYKEELLSNCTEKLCAASSDNLITKEEYKEYYYKIIKADLETVRYVLGKEEWKPIRI